MRSGCECHGSEWGVGVSEECVSGVGSGECECHGREWRVSVSFMVGNGCEWGRK